MDYEYAKEKDIKELYDLQLRAFESEAEMINSRNVPALMESYEENRADFINWTFLIKRDDSGKIIGAVRCRENGDHIEIGRVMVAQEHRNRGIATDLMTAVEELTQAKAFELYTCTKSYININLYEKLGYKIYKVEQGPSDLSFAYMRKTLDYDGGAGHKVVVFHVFVHGVDPHFGAEAHSFLSADGGGLLQRPDLAHLGEAVGGVLEGGAHLQGGITADDQHHDQRHHQQAGDHTAADQQALFGALAGLPGSGRLGIGTAGGLSALGSGCLSGGVAGADIDGVGSGAAAGGVGGCEDGSLLGRGAGPGLDRLALLGCGGLRHGGAAVTAEFLVAVERGAAGLASHGWILLFLYLGYIKHFYFIIEHSLKKAIPLFRKGLHFSRDGV